MRLIYIDLVNDFKELRNLFAQKKELVCSRIRWISVILVEIYFAISMDAFLCEILLSSGMNDLVIDSSHLWRFHPMNMLD